MKRIFAFLLILLLLPGCAGCSRLTQRQVWAMDTYMQLQLWGREAAAAADAVEESILQLEKTWSATEENSLLSRLNRGENAALTAEQSLFLEQLELWNRKTGGAFDPKLGSVSQAWGFGTDARCVPTEEALRRALAENKWDLGAAVKGYAGQQAVAILEDMAVTHALLNLGGNVQTYGEKPDGSPWRIGIQDPEGGEPLGILSVEGTMAVVTSGDYQRYFEENGKRYHHILNPKTGYPADNGLRSVTVICKDGLQADVMSTALFVMGQEKAVEFYQAAEEIEFVLVLADGTILATAGAALSGCEFEVIEHEK